MNVLITLNSGLGLNLGPDFSLASNGTPTTVVPATATKAQLLAGITVSVDGTATSVVVTSVGDCTNSLTIPIT